MLTKPDSSWIGKWFGIKGLMESTLIEMRNINAPLYLLLASKKSQLFIINEVEAKKRFAAKQQSVSVSNFSQKVSTKIF